MRLTLFRLGILSLLAGVACSQATTPSTMTTTPPNTVTRDTGRVSTDDPLLAPSTLPFGAPRFDRVAIDRFEPAFEEAMRLHLAEIHAIGEQKAQPTFENTIVAMERSGQLLNRVSTVTVAEAVPPVSGRRARASGASRA